MQSPSRGLSFGGLVLTIATVMLGQLLVHANVDAQAPDWSPERTEDRSNSAVAQRIASSRVRWPQPVRLAVHPEEVASVTLAKSPVPLSHDDYQANQIHSGNLDVSAPLSSSAGAEAVRHTRIARATAATSPAHQVIRSPQMQAKRTQPSIFDSIRAGLVGKRYPTVDLYAAQPGGSATGYEGQVAEWQSEVKHLEGPSTWNTSATGHGNVSSASAGASDHSPSSPGAHQRVSHRGLFHDPDLERLPPPPIHSHHSKYAKKKRFHGPTQLRQATIPGAREQPVWKQPYSYGYFGSKSSRHWSTHYGYRDRHTEFRYH